MLDFHCSYNLDNGNYIRFHHEAFVIYAKEAMFSLVSVCWFVRRITQKLLREFPWHLNGGWVSAQLSPCNIAFLLHFLHTEEYFSILGLLNYTDSVLSRNCWYNCLLYSIVIALWWGGTKKWLIPHIYATGIAHHNFICHPTLSLMNICSSVYFCPARVSKFRSHIENLAVQADVNHCGIR